jgi:hypothetical protein
MTNANDPTTRAEKDENLEKVSATIRLYVTNHVLPKFKDVDEEDAVTLLSILVEAGLVDPSKLSGDDCDLDLSKVVHFQCKGAHRNGAKKSGRRRISYTRIGKGCSPPWEFQTQRSFELLTKLDDLRILAFSRCKSFPPWIREHLPRVANSNLLDKNCDAEARDNNVPPVVVQKRLPNLEKLYLLNNTLESEDDLSKLLFDFLPLCPKLANFTVGGHKLQSFRKIAERINNSNELLRTARASRLQKLDLGQLLMFSVEDVGPARLRMRNLLYDDSLEVEAMKTILSAFRELRIARTHSLLYRIDVKADPGVEHIMEINYAGRVLVERNSDEIGETLRTQVHPTVSLSVWPIVLARAWKWNKHSTLTDDGTPCSDGIYYLLQNVPALREGSNRQRRQK